MIVCPLFCHLDLSLPSPVDHAANQTNDFPEYPKHQNPQSATHKVATELQKLKSDVIDILPPRRDGRAKGRKKLHAFCAELWAPPKNENCSYYGGLDSDYGEECLDADFVSKGVIEYAGDAYVVNRGGEVVVVKWLVGL